MTTFETKLLTFALFLLLLQGIWMFFDASKNGRNKWLWGFIGLLHLPSAIIIYLLITRVADKKISCPNCAYSIPAKQEHCKYCGHTITDKERHEGSKEYKKNEDENR